MKKYMWLLVNLLFVGWVGDVLAYSYHKDGVRFISTRSILQDKGEELKKKLRDEPDKEGERARKIKREIEENRKEIIKNDVNFLKCISREKLTLEMLFEAEGSAGLTLRGLLDLYKNQYREGAIDAFKKVKDDIDRAEHVLVLWDEGYEFHEALASVSLSPVTYNQINNFTAFKKMQALLERELRARSTSPSRPSSPRSPRR